MTYKIFLRSVLIVLCSLLAALVANAQNVTQPALEVPVSGHRVGVNAARQVTLTLQDAVKMALENNRDIEIERINVQLGEFNLRAARGAYDPVLNSSIYYESNITPVASLLAGGENGRLKETSFTGAATLTQRLPWFGGSIEAKFFNDRATSDNLFNSLNPQHYTGLTFTFTQPLLRNRATDLSRRQIKVAKKRLDLSDSQFRQRVIEIISKAQGAYWDLVFARRDHDIKRESVELARIQLEHNQRLVEKGTLAPLDVVSARVEVERRTDEAEAAVETIQRAENALKALLLQPDNGDLWGATVVPSDQPQIDPEALPSFDDALRAALQNRPEMEQYRLRGEINKVDVAYFRDQTKPQVDFIASYGTVGLAGTERTTINPLLAGDAILHERINKLSEIAGLPVLPPVTNAAVPEALVGGYGQSLENLFRNDYRAWRVGVTINLPIRNRTAKAQLGYALAEGKQVETERQRAQQTIEVEVRNALQAIEIARRRFEAARNSRVDAELQHQGEQRKFASGLSTNFLVLDRQNALSAARGRELRALTDYNKAMSELQRALSTTLSSNNISLK